MRNGTSVYTGLSARTIYQSDAPSDLKVVSWAPGVPFRKTTKSYAYDTASGEKSVVYVIENGIQGDDRVNNENISTARIVVDAVRNSFGHHHTGFMRPASDGRRQMTIPILTVLALHQRPPAFKMEFQRPRSL